MKNMVQDGKIAEYSNSGSAISSGDAVTIGDRLGVAITDIANGESGSVHLEGVFELAADNATAFSQGDQLYWDGTELTKTADGATYAGICFEDKATSTALASVRLQPHPKKAAHVSDASSGSAAEINALRDAMIEAGIMSSS